MQTVIGAFDDRATAQRAVERLVESGIGRDDVHVEQSDTAGTTTDMRSTSDTSGERRADEDRGALSSFGHFFASIFGEDHDRAGHADRYAEAVRRGSSVVIVDATTEEQAEKAASLLHELGAVDVDERAQQWRASGWSENTDQRRAGMDSVTSGTDSSLRNEGERALTGNREGVLDVVQEELQVGKRSIDRGGVRVIQRVSEKPVRELVRLREERAIVERRPVNREATAEDLSNFREGTIEVRETAEEPVVAKTARVVEEVRVGKDVQEREQTIEDSVRRKDVDVERLEGGREVERERAVAADRTSDNLSVSRDPDATDRTVTSQKKPRRDR